MKNRIVAFLLTIAICCGLFSVVAFADAADGFNYVILKQTPNKDGNYDFVDVNGDPINLGSGSAATTYGEIKNGEIVPGKGTVNFILDSAGTALKNYSIMVPIDVAAKEKGQFIFVELGDDLVQYIVIFQEHCGHDKDGHGYTYDYDSENGHTKTCSYCLYSDGELEAHDGKAETAVKESHTFTCSKCEEPVTVTHSEQVKKDGYCPDCKYAETTTVKFETGDGSKVDDVPNVKCGTTLTKPADPTWTGHTFKQWLKPDGTVFDFAKDKVTLGLVLKAAWDDALRKATVKVEGKGGTAAIVTDAGEVEEATIAVGTRVTVKTTPAKGYTLAKIACPDIEGGEANLRSDNTGWFVMPDADIELTVTFTK